MPGEGKQGRAETGAARRRIAPASHPFFLNRWRNSPARGGKPLPKFRFGSAPDCAARFAGRVAVTHSGLRVGVRVSGGVRSIRGAGFPRERNALPAGQAIGNALWVGAPRRVVRMARGCHSRRRLAGRPQRQENPEPGNGSSKESTAHANKTTASTSILRAFASRRRRAPGPEAIALGESFMPIARAKRVPNDCRRA
jgi:hypothetical protein